MKAVAEFLPVGKMARNVRVNAQKKFAWRTMELAVLKHRDASLVGTMIALKKDLFAVKVDCVCYR